LGERKATALGGQMPSIRVVTRLIIVVVNDGSHEMVTQRLPDTAICLDAKNL